MKKDYNKMILDRVELSLDRVMPLGSLVAFISSGFLFFSSIPKIFAVMDLTIGLMLLLLVYKKKSFNSTVKMDTLIVVPFVIGFLSFVDGGFESAGVSLFMISNALAALFLSRKKSIMVALISIVLFIILYLLAYIMPNETHVTLEFTNWMIHFLVLGLYLFIVHTMMFTVRDYLMENIEDLEDSIDTIYDLAYFDHLTGFMNQNLFSSELKKIISEGHTGHLVVYNLLNLHVINTIYDDAVGDRVLKAFASILNDYFYDQTMARMSGSEFGVWLDIDDAEQAKSTAVGFKKYFHDHFRVANMTKRIEFHTVMTYRDKGEPLVKLMHKSRLALTYAKKNNNSEILIYDEDLEKHFHYEELLRDRIDIAIENKSFYCVFQCKHDQRTFNVKGLEALARWQDDLLGQVPPCEFIPMIEQMGLAKRFGELILNNVFSSFEQLEEKYGDHISVAINVSPSLLMIDGFKDDVIRRAKSFDIDPKRIILEITEEVFISKLDDITSTLRALKKVGFKISLDDFGSGYSSLKYLSRLEIDELKIDRSFTNMVTSDDKVKKMVEVIVDLARYYELKITVEGIETEDEKAVLDQLDCDEYQGYYFSYPERI